MDAQTPHSNYFKGRSCSGNMTSNLQCYWHELPVELTIHILTFLDARTLSAFTQVGRHFESLATPILYKNITLPRTILGMLNNQNVTARLIRTLVHRPSLVDHISSINNLPIVLHPGFGTILFTSTSKHSPHPGPRRQLEMLPTNMPQAIMGSCQNLRHLTIDAQIMCASFPAGGGWLRFLLDPRIKLLGLTIRGKPYLQTGFAWDDFCPMLLTAQSELEYLDHPGLDVLDRMLREVNQDYPQSVSSWVPRLRSLTGSHISIFQCLLAPHRPIEAIVFRGVSITEISSRIIHSLQQVPTITSFTCHGQSGPRMDLNTLFDALPALRLLKLAILFKCSYHGFFSKELPRALQCAPNLEHVDLRNTGSEVDGTELVITAYTGPHPSILQKQKLTVEEYGTIVPALLSFVFPDERRWARASAVAEWGKLTAFWGGPSEERVTSNMVSAVIPQSVRTIQTTDADDDPITFRFQDLPEDVLVHVLGFLGSHTLSGVAQATRRLNTLATPILYHYVALPRSQNIITNHIATVQILTSLSENPSLAPFVQHLELSPSLSLLRSVAPIDEEHRQQGLISRNKRALPENLLDIMKSCTNLRSLVLKELVQIIINPGNHWTPVLLQPTIRLKMLTMFLKPTSETTPMWNQFLAQMLDNQALLEYLDYTGFCPEPRNPAQQITFSEARAETWTPSLRTLKGSRISAFTPLLSYERYIERLSVRGVSLADVTTNLVPYLRNARGLREFSCYQASSGTNFDLRALFTAIPDLQTLRIRISLQISLTDLFEKYLPNALRLAPSLREIDLKDTLRRRLATQPDSQIIFNQFASPEEEIPSGQAALLDLYSPACPTLEAVVFLDGRRWTRRDGSWILQQK